MPAASKYWANAEQLLDVLPGRFRRQSVMRMHKLQVRRQNRGKPSWGKRRRANTPTKLSSLVCFEEDSDRGPKNAGAAGTCLRGAPGKVLPYRVGACGRQKQTAFFEMLGEAQPFVKMLADYVIRVAQFQQPTSTLVHALLVSGRAIPPAFVTRKPV